METVVLVILLILALALIGVVLLQRSEGGGLGMGAGGVMSGRGQATALGRATWWIGGAFMAACVAMTIISARNSGGTSVVDQLRASPGAAEAADGDALPGLGGGSLLPPTTGDAPLVPTDESPVGDAPEAAVPESPVPEAAAPEATPPADGTGGAAPASE